MSLVGDPSRNPHQEALRNIVVVLAIASAVGAMAASTPLLLTLPLAGMAAAFAYRRPPYLLAATLLLSLAVLQSSEGLSPPKLAFLALYILVGFRAVATFRTSTATMDKTSERLAILSTVFLAAPIAVSIPVSFFSQVGLTSWLRDAAPYLQLALVPIVALGFSRLIRPRLATLLVSTVAIVGSIAFSLSWLVRRELTTFDAAFFGLASVSLAALGVSFFLVKAFTSRRSSPLWAFAAIICFSLVAVTGTRSAIVLLVPIPVVLAAYREKITTVRIRALIGALVMSAVALAAFAGVTDVNQATVTDRWRSLTGGVSEIALNDPSFNERSVQWEIAWSSFADHAILGRGLGFTYEYEVQYGSTIQSRGGFVLDTPVTFLSKYGLLGAVGLALSAGALMKLVRIVEPTREAMIIMAAYLITTLAYALLINPLEDKGFSIGLMLLLIYALGTSRHGSRTALLNSSRPGIRHLGNSTSRSSDLGSAYRVMSPPTKYVNPLDPQIRQRPR